MTAVTPEVQHNITATHTPRWLTLLVVLYAMVALLGAASTFYTLEVSRWYGPFRDMWDIFGFLRTGLTDGFSLHDLLEQYGNAHRPAIPRLLFLADNKWFSGSNLLLIGTAVVCQIITLCLWLWHTRFSCAHTVSRLTIYASAALLLFSPTLLYNFLYTFDVQWFIATLSVCVALHCLIWTDRPFVAQGWAFLALMPGILSNFAAVAAFPVMLFVVIVRRTTWREPVVLCLLIAAIVALYSVRLYPSINTTAVFQLTWEGCVQALQYALYVLVFFPLMYLLSPVSYFVGYPVLPVIVGVVTWLAWHCCRVLRNPQAVQRFELWCLALALFGYCVGVATALGRGYDPGQMFALRYQNIIVIFWLAIMTLLVLPTQRAIGDVADKWPPVKGIVTAIALYGGLFGSMHLRYLDEHILLGNNVRVAHTAIVLGMTDDLQAMRATISRPYLTENSRYQLINESNFLRERELGPFADEIAVAIRSHAAPPNNTYPDCEWQWHDRVSFPKGGERVYVRHMRFAAPEARAPLLFYRNDGQLAGAAWPYYGTQFLPYVLSRFRGTDIYAGVLSPLTTDERTLLILSVATGVTCRLAQ